MYHIRVTHPILESSEQIAKRHATINDVVKDVASTNTRLKYIEVDDFVKTRKDITDSINHYQTRVYYEIAQAMIQVIKDVTGVKVESSSKLFLLQVEIIKWIRPFVKRIVSQDSGIYSLLRKIYLKLTKRKINLK